MVPGIHLASRLHQQEGGGGYVANDLFNDPDDFGACGRRRKTGRREPPPHRLELRRDVSAAHQDFRAGSGQLSCFEFGERKRTDQNLCRASCEFQSSLSSPRKRGDELDFKFPSSPYLGRRFWVNAALYLRMKINFLSSGGHRNRVIP